MYRASERQELRDADGGDAGHAISIIARALIFRGINDLNHSVGEPDFASCSEKCKRTFRDLQIDGNVLQPVLLAPVGIELHGAARRMPRDLRCPEPAAQMHGVDQCSELHRADGIAQYSPRPRRRSRSHDRSMQPH